MESPYSFGQIVTAYEYIYDLVPSYDSEQQDSRVLANRLWDDLDENTRGEITDYWERPDGVQ